MEVVVLAIHSSTFLAVWLSLLLEASVDGKDTDPNGVGCPSTQRTEAGGL